MLRHSWYKRRRQTAIRNIYSLLSLGMTDDSGLFGMSDFVVGLCLFGLRCVVRDVMRSGARVSEGLKSEE